MGRGSVNVRFVTLTVNRESLNALVRLLETGEISVVIDQTYPFDKTASAVAHLRAHHARGKVALVA